MITEDLLNGVATSISSGTFSLPFSSVDVKLAPVVPSNNRPLTAVVGFDSVDHIKTSRCKWQNTQVIRVIISDFVGVGDIEAQALARIGLVAEVVEHLKTDAYSIVSGGDKFVLSEVRTDPHYSYEALIEESFFLSAIFLTYTGYK